HDGTVTASVAAPGRQAIRRTRAAGTGATVMTISRGGGGGGRGGRGARPAGQGGVGGEAAVVAAEGLGDDQGGEQGRGQVLEGGLGPRGRGVAGQQEGAGGLDGDRGQADHEHADPDGVHEGRLAPMRQARLAATIGTPGPVKGMRTSAMAAPPRAARSRERSRTWDQSRVRNRAGKAASRPSDSGSATRSPAKAPMAVPVVQHTSSSRPAPTSRCRSTRPSSRWAMAPDSSAASRGGAAR